jgi:hypothetical protein
MPRPGVDVNIVDEFIPGQAILDPGQSFMIGLTERGPVGVAGTLHSSQQLDKMYGARTADSAELMDSGHAFFNEGGSTLYISRGIGPAAVSATGVLGDLTITAKGPGVWGNKLVVTATVPGGSLSDVAAGATSDYRVFQVEDDDVVVERSTICKTVDDAVAWSMDSGYINIEITDPDDPSPVLPDADESIALTAGADDQQWSGDIAAAALDAFPYNLGPGQVSAPGRADVDTWTAIGAHLLAMHRVGIPDLSKTNDPTVLASEVGTIWTIPGARQMLPCGSWLNYPYDTNPATVVIPYSGMQSGLIALADSANDPSIAAAGADGISRYALGLTDQFTDADREELNDLGVCLGKEIFGQVRTYGYRTGAGPDEKNWMFFQESRVVMMIAHECDAVMEEYVLKTIDGHNHLFAKVNTACTGVCQKYYLANALYGDTPGEAFKVDTGPGINTIDTIKKGWVLAQVLVKTSRQAEWIVINLIKKPIESAF